MQKVDETIDALCDWIQKELENSGAGTEKSILPDMVKALAELVVARSELLCSKENSIERSGKRR